MKMCYENSDQYFRYRNVAYFTGTHVSFSDNFMTTYRYEGKPIWKYARFYKRINNTYVFTRLTTDFWWLKEHNMNWDDYKKTCPFFILDKSLLDNAIEVIDDPIEVTIQALPQYKDWEVTEVMVGWVIYILVLFFSLVFKDFYIIWIAASFLFFTFRKGMLNR